MPIHAHSLIGTSPYLGSRRDATAVDHKNDRGTDFGAAFVAMLTVAGPPSSVIRSRADLPSPASDAVTGIPGRPLPHDQASVAASSTSAARSSNGTNPPTAMQSQSELAIASTVSHERNATSIAQPMIFEAPARVAGVLDSPSLTSLGRWLSEPTTHRLFPIAPRPAKEAGATTATAAGKPAKQDTAGTSSVPLLAGDPVSSSAIRLGRGDPLAGAPPVVAKGLSRDAPKPVAKDATRGAAAPDVTSSAPAVASTKAMSTEPPGIALRANQMHTVAPAALQGVKASGVLVTPVATAGREAPANVTTAAAAAAPRLVRESVPPPTPAHTTTLKIELGNGDAAHASVRERSGTVAVRIVTNSSPVALHLGGEIDSLRRGLEEHGFQLQSADVSYRGESGGQRREPANEARDFKPRPPQDRSAFILNEVSR